MLLPFEELNSTDIEVSGIKVLLQSPSYRHMPMTKRSVNGLLYVTRGKGTYLSENGSIVNISAGSVIYLPCGCMRSFSIDKDGIDFYRVDFELRMHGEIAYFSYDPLLLADEAPPNFKECIVHLEEESKYDNNRIETVRWLLGAFSALLPNRSASYKLRIGPALKYIDSHFTEEINCHKLAEICYLSTSQFYNLFYKKMKKTPLEYRNSLLLRRAVLLLESGECSVNEVAENLGFASAAYFSRFFKKHNGIAPSRYLKTTHSKKS